LASRSFLTAPLARNPRPSLFLLKNRIQNLAFAYDGPGNLTSRTSDGGMENLIYEKFNRRLSSKQGSYAYQDNGNLLGKPSVGNIAVPNYCYED